MPPSCAMHSRDMNMNSSAIPRIPGSNDTSLIFTASCGLGNASGGSYPGFYRTFVVDEVGGRFTRSAPQPRIHFGLFSVPYEGRVRTGNSKTSLVVAVSDGRRHHNSLQLWVEKYWRPSHDFVEVTHDGRLAFGRGGAIPRDTVLESVRKYAPTLLRNGEVFLGRFSSSRRSDWILARDMLLRLARYALVRDRVRDAVRRASSG